MFANEARNYITGLIAIQHKIRATGYRRSDQVTVNGCLAKLETLLKAWKYPTNELMSGFWRNHREEIRYLVPTNQYKGFKALIYHFEYLDKESKTYIKQTKEYETSN